jgi:very-short-patch-repair endonuclease
MVDVVSALARLGGVAESASLRAAGVDPRALRFALDAGSIFRLRRGCYALATADPVRIAETAWRGNATCVTALRAFGLPLINSDSRVHLQVRPNRTGSGRNVRPPRHVVIHSDENWRTPIVTAAEAINSSHRCLTPINQLVAIDAALNRGLIALDDVAALTGGGSRRRSWLYRQADQGAQSPLETLTRVALRQAGFSVKSQVSIPHVGRVDLVVNSQVIVEVDGQTYHSNEHAFREDRRRDRAAVIAGFTVMRFTRDDVFMDLRGVVRQVRAALGRTARGKARSQ